MKNKNDSLLGKIDRQFLESWLSRISEIVEKVGESIDSTSLSLFCQIASMACLQERHLMPENNELALDFSMDLTKMLWQVTIVGAKEMYKEQFWKTLFKIDWREKNSAWHNIHVPVAILGFKSALKELFSEFPLLKDNDNSELAEISPSIKIINQKNGVEREYSAFIDFNFLDAFLSSQMNEQIGPLPKLDDTTDIIQMSKNEASKTAADLSLKTIPVILAHLFKNPIPQNISHETLFQKLISTTSFSDIWKKTLNKIKKNGKDQSKFLEIALENTFLSSYEAAYQFFNSSELLLIQSENSSKFKKICEILPTLLGETYKLNFPSLSSEQISRLVNKNPIYIYTELKRNNEFSRIASIIDKEGKNEKKDSLNDFITLLQKNLQKNIAPPQRRVAATSDMVFYRDALKEMDDVGEFLGVISHELGHVIDEVIKDPAIIEKITKKYNVIINAEDYAKWGEKELFADISTLNFYATLFDKEEDIQRRNRLIQTYARLRKLRKGLYMPFLKEPIIELGSSLKSAIVVRTLAEEYEHIANQKCDECGAEFDRLKLDRKSYVIYHGKPHDVLRCYCSLCNKSKDFFFDFIRTMMGSDEEKAETIEDWKKIYGEIKDPIPDDIFS